MSMSTMVELTTREITLIRCGLLRRCDVLKDRPDMKDSYDLSITLLQRLWDARKLCESNKVEG